MKFRHIIVIAGFGCLLVGFGIGMKVSGIVLTGFVFITVALLGLYEWFKK